MSKIKTNVVIIGGGIVGIATAQELLEQGVKDVMILEKNTQIMRETSSHNSGLIHGGFDATPGSLKAIFNVEGRHMLEERYFNKNVTAFSHAKIKSFILAYNDADINELDKLYEQGIANGLKAEEMEIISGDAVREIDKYISKDVLKAFVCNSSTVIDPYGFGQFIYSESNKLGLTTLTSFKVQEINKTGETITILAADGREVEANFIINASGTYAESIARMVEDEPEFKIENKRGQYIILDRTQASKVGFNVYFLTPSKHGKGVIVAPQFDGRVLVGPSAENDVPIDDIQNVTTAGLEFVRKIGAKINPHLDMSRVETVMAGSRPMNVTTNDYHIKMSNNTDYKMMHIAGTQSPALSGVLAIAKYSYDIYLKNK